MFIDTQPATHQHEPPSPEQQERWVDAELVSVLLRQVSPALLQAMVAVAPGVALLFWSAGPLPAGVWLAAMAGLLAYTHRGVQRLLHGELPRMQETLAAAHGLASAHGVLWGVGAGAVFWSGHGRAELLALLLVLCMAVLALGALSARHRLFRGALAGMGGGFGLALVGATLWPAHGDGLRPLDVGVLLVVFGVLLDRVAQAQQDLHRSGLELQYANQTLIDSLTLQTQAAMRAVASKNRFLASSAHDLRQPVHAMSLYAEWLAAEPQQAPAIAPRILKSARAINELFNSLFDLTRIDAGNFKLNMQDLSVRQVFADLLLQYQPLADEKGLKLKARAPDIGLRADAVVLRRMLGNLMSNAIRHTSSGGVLLGLRVRQDMLVFEVWDTGVGIPRELRQSIFQEFFRVSQHQGTEDSLGLGLTIVSRLATLMGYQLFVASEPGRGSVFRVLVPGQWALPSPPAGS